MIPDILSPRLQLPPIIVFLLHIFKMDGTTTGRLWSELLHSLTKFCNSCDQNGTIPIELPIVEQIPILHRLG